MKECSIKDRSNRGQRGICVEEKGGVTGQRKKCGLRIVWAELVIKSEIKAALGQPVLPYSVSLISC